uniref:Uncharacterized protein n=1 Tax=Arundo donax TaxID=35708 RepID=A0A0A9DFC8_ARUDO
MNSSWFICLFPRLKFIMHTYHLILHALHYGKMIENRMP